MKFRKEKWVNLGVTIFLQALLELPIMSDPGNGRERNHPGKHGKRQL